MSAEAKTYTPQELNSAKLFSQQGKIAVVTGGGTGIGLMITRVCILFIKKERKIFNIALDRHYWQMVSKYLFAPVKSRKLNKLQKI